MRSPDQGSAVVQVVALRLQGGVLDKISVADFGILVAVVLAVVVLVDSEFTWFSDDQPILCGCHDQGGEQGSHDLGVQRGHALASGVRARPSRRRLRYRSRAVTRIRARSTSGPDRPRRPSPHGRDRSQRCATCSGVLNAGISAVRIDKSA